MSSDCHFLVVDDVPFMRRVAIISLRALGYRNISEAEDGEQALRLLQSAVDAAAPVDFVVTDWSMPCMDGLALLRTIRARDDLKHLPVLMVSAQMDDSCVMVAERAGADGYIPKPMSAAVLKPALDAIWAKRGRGTRPRRTSL